MAAMRQARRLKAHRHGRVHKPQERPTRAGWYACRAIDDRWGGQMRYRAWAHGLWWTPLRDGWVSGRDGVYRWRGPMADVQGPAPDGTNPCSGGTGREE